MKAQIDYDTTTGVGALFFDDVQLCDIQLPDGQAEVIRELITEHILKEKGGKNRCLKNTRNLQKAK